MLLAALAAGPRRRLTCVATLTEVTVLGISTLVLGLSSGGWYVYYVFQLMSEPWLSLYYRECPQPLLADVPATEFRPVAGGIASRPFAVWPPQGRGSCPTAVSILDGFGKETP